MLYSALEKAVYAPVNQAAKHLGFTLEYGQSYGKQHCMTFPYCYLLLSGHLTEVCLKVETC